MRRIRHGFSLVELMIVVAIIGILAAIAIPNLMTMQYKAKRSEVPGNVDGIKTAEIAYDAAFDGYLGATVAPRTTGPDKTAVEWVAADPNWDSIGWRPDGAVRGVYAITLLVCPEDNTDYDSALVFCVTGDSDVDGDSNDAQYFAGPLLNATIFPGDESVY